MEKQVEKEHYDFLSYLSKARWNSYYHQIEEVLKNNSQNALIIGKGDGIVPDILKKQIEEVKIFDIAEDLQPDYLGNILEMSNIINKKFDSILCCQVLEHLPFDKFEQCISELSKVTDKQVIISLPQKNIFFNIGFKIPKIPKIDINIYIPRFYKNFTFEKDGNGEHYWELNVKNYPVIRIRKILEKYFILKNEYTVKENSYHRFFILGKKK